MGLSFTQTSSRGFPRTLGPDALARLRRPESGASLPTTPPELEAAGFRGPGGYLQFFRPERLALADRLMRRVYDSFAAVHDPVIRMTLPVFEGRNLVEVSRRRIIELLELNRAPEGPVRVLEVGIGTGANLPGLVATLGARAELWGLDTSFGMLRRAGEFAEAKGWPVHLVLADAHRLPFPSATFDRVLHVGGLNAFSDPARALAEMARVTKPGGPIVVVDEQLAPSFTANVAQRAAFRLVTAFDRIVRAPVDALPPGCDRVEQGQLSPFFYWLRYTHTAPEALSAPWSDGSAYRRTRDSHRR